MRIDPVTLLFHDLTADEAQVLQLFGEAVMLRGEHPAEQPEMIQEWFKLKPEFQGPNGIFALSAILPARIFYSLLLHQQEERVLLPGTELHDSPATARRLRDGAHAMSLPEPPADAAAVMLKAYLREVGDGIRALQSLDDLGPVRNEWAMRNHDELQARYNRAEARLKALSEVEDEFPTHTGVIGTRLRKHGLL